MYPGERIKKFRKKNGIKLKDFSLEVDYSCGYLSEIEHGKKEPSRELLKKITKVYGISSDYVLYGSEEDRIKHLLIREAGTQYQILPISTKKIIDKVKEILESGNEGMINLFKDNTNLIWETVRAQKNTNENKGGD